MNSTVAPSWHFGMHHQGLTAVRPTCLAYVDGRTREIYLSERSYYCCIHMYTVSILGFENCQSFFSATAHVRCTAPARPTPRGRCRSAYSIFYWQNDTVIVICLQHASNCIKNTILSLFYIKLVVYYNKRSRKSRGIADLKRNP